MKFVVSKKHSKQNLPLQAFILVHLKKVEFHEQSTLSEYPSSGYWNYFFFYSKITPNVPEISAQKIINVNKMIFHLNQHLVRITDIKRSFVETDKYTSPSLDIHYINIDTQEKLIKTLTPLSPYWNFFLKIEKSLQLKLSEINPPANIDNETIYPTRDFLNGNLFILQNSFCPAELITPPIVEYRDECLICLKITSCWKKLHPSEGDQPPHLVCTGCRINLFRLSSQPNCPLCLRHIYTLSFSFYYRCFCCNQTKKYVTSSTHPHIKCHQDLGHSVCNPGAQEKHNCPICFKKINPHDVWSESS